jgi:hypothetical protein
MRMTSLKLVLNMFVFRINCAIIFDMCKIYCYFVIIFTLHNLLLNLCDCKTIIFVLNKIFLNINISLYISNRLLIHQQLWRFSYRLSMTHLEEETGRLTLGFVFTIYKIVNMNNP